MRPDAEYFDCLSEVEHSRTILKRGASAHRQLALFEQARSAGEDDAPALRDVVDMLREKTVAGL